MARDDANDRHMPGPKEVRPYVTDEDFRQAVTGHETEILDALGIAWNTGHPHIKCPYGSHPDKHPSWRWDGEARRAFCTCSQGDDIAGAVMKVRDLDYPQAKLWIVAHALHRDDLIRTIGEHDPHWYLHPPPAKRDDSLPRAYLAFRLGMLRSRY